MKLNILYWLFSLLALSACTTANKGPKLALDKVHKENLKIDKEIKSALPFGGLRAVQDEKIAFLNVHDFPDSTLLSAKIKMNPPDLAIDEAKLLQMERSEILRQALETYCDSCENFEVLLPIDKLSENQFNFFFDKIFLRQEVKWDELAELVTELGSYDKLVLILSSEDYEKNRGFNKEKDVVAFSESFIKSEIYVFDLKKKGSIGRINLNMSNTDYLFYSKKLGSNNQRSEKLKDSKNIKIKTLLNDIRYDEVYPYPIAAESLTLFYFFYDELGKLLFKDAE